MNIQLVEFNYNFVEKRKEKNFAYFGSFQLIKKQRVP